jgi:N-dimethylarginine dimethylaminohydrolase
MKENISRREFVKATGAAAAAAAATGLTAQTAHAKPPLKAASTPISVEGLNTIAESVTYQPGMREQGGGGIKCYVESEYAPLKACMVGNASSVYIPDLKTWEMQNLFAHSPKWTKDYLRKYGGQNMKDADPKTYEKIVKETAALAEAYRKAGVKVIRNEGETPEAIVNQTYSWSQQKHNSIYGQSAFEVFGHCLVSLWEVSISYGEIAHREAMVNIVTNDPEAVWLTMPAHYPINSKPQIVNLTPGDPRIFPKTVLLGFGVPDPAHVKDYSKPRSSGNEMGAEILRRMLEPFGWSVEICYFDTKFAYHLDCIMSVLDEGLLAMPKDCLWTELPKQYRDWEVLEVSDEDCLNGACNNVPLGNKQLVMTEGTKMARDLEKRGWTVIEVPYTECYRIFGSGIHCSTASIWRES